MAVMIPDTPLDFNHSQGEQEIFDALKTLDERCYVFHSLRWVGSQSNQVSTAQGEADFTIFDPMQGLLVIEVKSGWVKCVGRRWYQTNRNTGVEREIQDPEQQANRSRFELIARLQDRLPRGEQCAVWHAVWFPSGKFDRSLLSMNYPSGIVLDIEALSDPKESINEVFKWWQQESSVSHNLSRERTHKVLELIAPEFGVIPSLKATFEKREKQFIQMTKRQTSILDFLEEQNTAVINGAAGTGKTVVGLEKARRFSERGESVLFLCFNRALRDFLQKGHDLLGVDFQTFHSLARKLVGNNNQSFDQLENQFLEWLSNSENPWLYHHLIVDEGQDFESEWLEWLMERTPGCRYVFYDKNQLIFRDRLPSWIEKAECKLVLNKNCRNTLQISRTAYRFVDLPFSNSDELVHGPKTYLYECNKHQATSSVDGIIAKSVTTLLQQNAIKPEDIAILTLQTEDRSTFADIKAIRGCPISQSIEKDKICFTSVRKFKGLEAKVIFLIDVPLNEFSKPDVLRRLYVGCSRATHELHLLFDDLTQESINVTIDALSPGTKLKRSKQTLGKLLNASWAIEEKYVQI